MLKSRKDLVVRDWKQDLIYLIQYPRFGVIPNCSPWSLKLETFIRFAKLNYTNVSNEFKFGSAKGQVPFIELNGRQIADSNFIIDNLKTTFNLSIDRNLNEREKADERAYSVLVEESLLRAMFYYRSRNFQWLATDKGIIRHFTGIKKIFFQKVVTKRMESRIKAMLNAQGYGRHNLTEIADIAKRDLTALSNLLGSKSYFFGNSPSTLDATAFGVLAQIIETPLQDSDLKEFIEKSTPNLLDFVRRVQRDYWPDWEIICKNLAMNSSDIKDSPDKH